MGQMWVQWQNYSLLFCARNHDFYLFISGGKHLDNILWIFINILHCNHYRWKIHKRLVGWLYCLLHGFIIELELCNEYWATVDDLGLNTKDGPESCIRILFLQEKDNYPTLVTRRLVHKVEHLTMEQINEDHTPSNFWSLRKPVGKHDPPPEFSN